MQFSAAIAFDRSSASRNDNPCRDGIAKRTVKNVSSAGRVDTVDHECRRVDVFAFAERKSSVRAQSHGRYLHLVLGLNHLQRFEGVTLAGPLTWKFGTRNQVIDVRQYAFEAMIDGVDVDSHGDAVLSCDARRRGRQQECRDRRCEAFVQT